MSDVRNSLRSLLSSLDPVSVHLDFIYPTEEKCNLSSYNQNIIACIVPNTCIQRLVKSSMRPEDERIRMYRKVIPYSQFNKYYNITEEYIRNACEQFNNNIHHTSCSDPSIHSLSLPLSSSSSSALLIQSLSSCPSDHLSVSPPVSPSPPKRQRIDDDNNNVTQQSSCPLLSGQSYLTDKTAALSSPSSTLSPLSPPSLLPADITKHSIFLLTSSLLYPYTSQFESFLTEINAVLFSLPLPLYEATTAGLIAKMSQYWPVALQPKYIPQPTFDPIDITTFSILSLSLLHIAKLSYKHGYIGQSGCVININVIKCVYIHYIRYLLNISPHFYQLLLPKQYNRHDIPSDIDDSIIINTMLTFSPSNPTHLGLDVSTSSSLSSSSPSSSSSSSSLPSSIPAVSYPETVVGTLFEIFSSAISHGLIAQAHDDRYRPLPPPPEVTENGNTSQHEPNPDPTIYTSLYERVCLGYKECTHSLSSRSPSTTTTTTTTTTATTPITTSATTTSPSSSSIPSSPSVPSLFNHCTMSLLDQVSALQGEYIIQSKHSVSQPISAHIDTSQYNTTMMSSPGMMSSPPPPSSGDMLTSSSNGMSTSSSSPDEGFVSSYSQTIYSSGYKPDLSHFIPPSSSSLEIVPVPEFPSDLLSIPYLCTSYDLILTREPCTLCAMAALHSRFQRVIFLTPHTSTGALATLYTLHTTTNVNHKYQVYHLRFTPK